MRRTAACFAALLCLAALPASAADDAASLDLSLPQAAAYRSDPPGTWYGDTSGVPAGHADAPVRIRRACPTAPDGSATDLTGNVRAGVGYSSHGGNSNWQGASLNYCKTYADSDGDEHTVNMQLHVDQYDGPDMGPFRAPPMGPGPWGGAPRR